MPGLRSPITGAPLRRSGHALHGAAGERWPVLDEIAFLRADRRALADAALARLDANDPDGALVILLADQDPWAAEPPPSLAARRAAVAQRDRLTLREAMALLLPKAIVDYFTHRWSDPTFLSGLALIEAHGGTPARVIELACGHGALLRALARQVPSVTGLDIVFAKLWLARHWVAPSATLICADAATRWPLDDDLPALVLCHDAFYFLSDKPLVAAEVQRVAGPAGRVLIGHAHNRLVDTHPAGTPLAPTDYAALFPGARLYDDAELTRAFVAARAPHPASAAALATAAAIALVWNDPNPPQCCGTVYARPPSATCLRRNPLYAAGEDGRLRRHFPSPRYEAEYAALATYPPTTTAPATLPAAVADLALVRTRVLLDLPTRW